jgi:transcriptional regulator with XRE-family HTH domain
MRTDRRDEFAAFLRTRRERLSPADVGLPAGTRRRVAGLRREEVATLAGVGLTWYTWLEQGRPIAASDQVLGAIARALRMTEDERDHLFALAGATPPERDEHACVSAAHLDLLSKLMPYPAAVQTARFDIRAYNRSYRFLFADLDDRSRRPQLRGPHLHRSGLATRTPTSTTPQQRIVARLRAAYGRHHDEPGWQRFIAQLEEQSPPFAELWRRGDVATEHNAVKRLEHPRWGTLQLAMTSLWTGEAGGQRVVWFRPQDAATARRLDVLARYAAEEPVLSGSTPRRLSRAA